METTALPSITSPEDDFFHLYRHGFIRAAVCVPDVKVADPSFNVAATVGLARQAAEQKAILAIFPELGLSAYSNEDLFHQQALLDGVRESLKEFLNATADMNIILVVGAPLRVNYGLFNCGLVIYRGKILGVTVKSYLPNYREYYEGRQFRPAKDALNKHIDLCGQEEIPFGADLIFKINNIPNFTFFIETCEDLWVPVQPSGFAALAGATVIGNLSASNITVGKSEYRHQLAAVQSARLVCAYLYAAAGSGESTTDLAWDGHAMIYECGELLAETKRFSYKPQVLCADLDLDRIQQERLRLNSFSHNAHNYKEIVDNFRLIPLSVSPIDGPLSPKREFPRFPFIPADKDKRHERCYESYNIQVHGLVKRLKFTGIEKVVIGVSGGLDSTQALLVSAQTMDLLQLPRTNVLAYTLPAFGTSRRTYLNARRLMDALGVEANEIDIRPSCEQMLKDLGRPQSAGAKLYDITYENIQAGQRASYLFRLANMRQALVVGTGDLSELALGWCTYGVGDHMSHYNVNASIPKTFIQYLIRWVAETNRFSSPVSEILFDILETEISPELIPGDDPTHPAQKTEEIIGPYELHDFYLYYTTRFGYLPTKIAFMAYWAWHDKSIGPWPEVPDDKRHCYTLAEIKKWLLVFLKNFFQISQFKRSCSPNGPKVASGSSLSPRGDYRAPSDSEAAIWLLNGSKIPD